MRSALCVSSDHLDQPLKDFQEMDVFEQCRPGFLKNLKSESVTLCAHFHNKLVSLRDVSVTYFCTGKEELLSLR